MSAFMDHLNGTAMWGPLTECSVIQERALTIYGIAALSGQAYCRALLPANITAGLTRLEFIQ